MKSNLGLHLLFLFFYVFASHFAQAQTMGFYLRDQVKVLPKSRYIVSVVGFQSDINSQLDSSGKSTSIQNKLNRSITFKDITDDDPNRKNQLVGLFKANNIHQAADAGYIQGSVKGFADGQIPLIGYGLTDNTMLILALPILHFRIQAQNQFIKSQTTQSFLKKLEQQDESSTAKDFDSAFDSSMQSKLYRAGYIWNPDVDKKMVGDLQLTVLNQIDSNQSAIAIGLIFPTATAAATDDVYQLSGGERKWAASAKYTKQHTLSAGLSLTQSIENLLFLPTQQNRRLYLNETSDLKEGFDEASISWVNQTKYQIQMRYEFPKWIGLTGGFSWQYRTGEKLSGQKYADYVYDINSRSNDQDLKSAYVALDLNSINSFLQGHFLLPMALEFSSYHTLAGRNVLSEPVYQLQGSLFF